MEHGIFEQRSRVLKDFTYLPLFYLIPDEIAQKGKWLTYPATDM